MRRLFLLFILPFFSVYASQGIDYTYLECPNNSYFSWVTGYQAIHVIEVDPNEYEIKPVKALDNGLGRETVLSLAERHGAVASINGGFFTIGGTFDGKACGTLKIHDWIALPFKPRGCIGWSEHDQTPILDRLLVDAKIYYDQTQIPIDGLNRPRKNGEIVVYTPNFHRSTLTKPDGEEIVVINGVIESIVKGGSTKIPENGFVLSVQDTHPLFHSFEMGKKLTFSTNIYPLEGLTTADEWNQSDYIVGGTPLLFHEKTDKIDYIQEKTIETFLTNRHARTAVGVLPNGHLLFVVVDHTSLFDGMTMDELKELMIGLGCIAALNLDGGGSSTMVFNGNIVNTPHGDEDENQGEKAVRRVSDAIIICPKIQQVASP